MAEKRVLVLGASGGTGQLVVAQALQRGMMVTAFVRDPSRLSIESDRLHVQVGDATVDDGPLTEAMRGQHAVISALGVGKSFKSGGLISQATPRIIRAMKAAGVGRIIATSAFGVGETRRDVPLIPRLFMSSLLRDVYRDKAAGDAQIKASSLDWTIVYPAGLADRPATGRYRVGERLSLSGFPTIARADLAGFLVDQVDDKRYVQKGVLVST